MNLVEAVLWGGPCDGQHIMVRGSEQALALLVPVSEPVAHWRDQVIPQVEIAATAEVTYERSRDTQDGLPLYVYRPTPPPPSRSR